MVYIKDGPHFLEHMVKLQISDYLKSSIPKIFIFEILLKFTYVPFNNPDCILKKIFFKALLFNNINVLHILFGIRI